MQSVSPKWARKMQFDRSLKVKKVPEYVTMRKETVDLTIRSWLCSTQVGSSSAVNLRLDVTAYRSGYQPDIRRYISIQFNSIHCVHVSSCRSVCQNKYGNSPDFVINGHLNATFPYIQPPLEYILTELLKNSFRYSI